MPSHHFGSAIRTCVALSLLACGGLALADGGKGQPDSEDTHLGTIAHATNGVYNVYVQTAGQSCGAWSATTGPLHPAPGQNIIWGGEFPATTAAAFRSQFSGRLYRIGNRGISTQPCYQICGLAVPEVELLPTPADATMIRTTWTFEDIALSGLSNTVQLVQELSVEHDGATPSVANSRIRETHHVRNLGGANLRFSFSKLWDWQIGWDDGPWYAECDDRTAGCDRGFALRGDAQASGLYPNAFVVNADPATSACPGTLVPQNPDGCEGRPPFLVAATIADVPGLAPPPDPPEEFQFAYWGTLMNRACLWAPPTDGARCGIQTIADDDTASAWFYGIDDPIELLPLEERLFTQYIIPPGCLSCRPEGPPLLAGCPPDELTVSCSDIPAPAVVTASDECECVEVSFTETPQPGGCTGAYDLVRTWTAVGSTGLESSCSQVLHVIDDLPPVLCGCPDPVTVECGEIPPPAMVAALDDCDIDVLPQLTETPLPGGCPSDRSLLRTWTARDACGNQSSCSQVVTVRDTRPPRIQGCPSDEVAACGASAPPVLTASDDCDPMPRLELRDEPVSTSCAGSEVRRRTWTATDACGNASTCTQVLVVEDQEAPVVTPSETEIACLWPANHDYACFRPEDFAPVISDSCGGPTTWRFASCTSDQPDDAPDIDFSGDGSTDDEYWSEPSEDGDPGCFNADGNTDNDCVVTSGPGGNAICVRAERAGQGPGSGAGRTYRVLIVAEDACGNESAETVIATIRVPRTGQAAAGCLDVNSIGCTGNDGLPCRDGERMFPPDSPVPTCP